MDHPRGVWLPGFATTEFAVASERYDMTLSLLLLSAEGTRPAADRFTFAESARRPPLSASSGVPLPPEAID
jgi:hypothetical protein